MSAEIKTELQIPDLWFDFYARLLPGLAFVAALRTLIFSDRTVPAATELVVIVAVGFFCGLLSQPFSSRIVGGLEWSAAKIRHRSTDYVNIITKQLDSSNRALILSKMHGEVTFFTQLAVLSVGYGLVNRFCPPAPELLAWYISVIFLGALGLAFEVADRRVKRAEREERLLDEAVLKRPVA